MMKQLLCLLLAAALLLGGCALTQAPEPVETEAPSTTAPTEPLYETTAGGITVKTDYSAYTARIPPEEKCTRLSEGPLPKLIASEDYGAIYPYIGSKLYSKEHSSSAGYLYGMMDENGRILTDPVYTSVGLVAQNEYDNEAQRGPFWVLSCEGDAYTNEYGYETADYFCALASLDGSFVTDCIYSSALGIGDVILATRQVSDQTVLEVFDASGDLIYSSLEHPFAYPLFPSANEYSYDNGILLLFAEVGGRESYGAENGDDASSRVCAFYFADLEGNLLSGPYENAGSFSCGYSAVRLDDGSYAYLSSETGKLSEKTYLSAGDFVNGFACVDIADDDRGYCIINADGEVVNELREGDSLPYYYNDVYHLYDDGREYLYDYRGEPLYADSSTAGSYRTLGSNIQVNTNYDSNGYLLTEEVINTETGERYQVPDGFQTSYLSCTKIPYILLEHYDQVRSGDAYILLDKDFNELAAGPGDFYLATDPLTGTSCPVIAYKGLQLYDMDMNELCTLPQGSDWVWRYGDRIMLCDSFSCSYYDLDGNLLFRHLLADASGD